MSRFNKIIIGTYLLFIPLITSAQLTPPSNAGTGLPDITRGRGLTGAVEYVINFILIFAGIIAVLFLIIGGYQYITSAGNDELAGQGKKTIQNAIIGIVVIILSYTLVAVIFRTLTGTP